MKFARREQTIDCVQWWPPGDDRHLEIPGVDRGPRGDQGWGFVKWDGGWAALTPGAWVELDRAGAAFDLHSDAWLAKHYVEVGGGA